MQHCPLGRCPQTAPCSDPRQPRQIRYSRILGPALARTTRTERPRQAANSKSVILRPDRRQSTLPRRHSCVARCPAQYPLLLLLENFPTITDSKHVRWNLWDRRARNSPAYRETDWVTSFLNLRAQLIIGFVEIGRAHV